MRTACAGTADGVDPDWSRTLGWTAEDCSIGQGIYCDFESNDVCQPARVGAHEPFGGETVPGGIAWPPHPYMLLPRWMGVCVLSTLCHRVERWPSSKLQVGSSPTMASPTRAAASYFAPVNHLRVVNEGRSAP